jgi:NodT family efflux transporter outer membrane factor (OMF) lipoprotein
MKAFYEKILVRLLLWLSIMLTIVILSGCKAVGPDYVMPETPVSASWHSQLEGGLSAEEMDKQTVASWWTTLNDPILTSLIDRAVAGNLDLKSALARVRQSRALRNIAGAGLFPTLNIGASDTFSRGRKDIGTGETNELYAANFDAGWELDIFGGVRRSVESATADLQARRENERDVLVSLLAEVALNYVEVRTYQARLASAQANLETQNETYQLTQWRNEAGLGDELAVQQALYNLVSTRSQIPSLRTGLEETINRIAVLLGEQPGRINEELTNPESIPVTPLSVAVGVPAEMLRRRPDVRQAERELASQTAQIGVAAAELYPRLSLDGSIGIEAGSLRNLLRNASSSDTWTLSGGPRVSWAIFDAGRIRQNIQVQSALQEQALIQYEAVILGALEDVENALVSYAQEQQRREDLREATQAAQKAAELARNKYEAGLTDFNNVLDTQRSVLSFQDQLAQSNGTVTTNLIRLYKALGGGWTSMAENENK